MFASCSNEDNVDPVESENGSVTFELSAVNEIESGSVTRAPVYSQEATQHVTQVDVYAFKKSGSDYLFEKSYNIAGWTDGTTFKRFFPFRKRTNWQWEIISSWRLESEQIISLR